MFFKKSSQHADFLIVGLGNPGGKYDKTRHNIGFEALDYAANKWGIDIRKAKFDGLYGQGIINCKKVVLLKPYTFMNLSGNSVKRAVDFYKIPPEKVLVLFDDVSLSSGKLRIRSEGSAGGHNGLKSIISHIGQSFMRIKIGVGEKPHPDYDLADWVLSRFSEAERKAVEDRFSDIMGACELIVGDNFTQAMNHYNGEKH